MNTRSVVPFTFESQNIRALNLDGEPWFVAQDVCSVLNIKNVTQFIERLDADERSMFNIGLEFRSMFDKRVQDINIISESGMYTLVLRCRDAVKQGSLPHRFRKWVTSEVLPSIRKTGSYAKSQPRQCAATAEQLTPLRQTAERLITTGVANIYPDIWELVHQRFDVQHINQLLPEQVSEAVNYLDAIEGEFIGKQAELAAPKLNLNFPMSWWHQYRKIFEARGLDHVDIDKPWNLPAKFLYGDASDSPSAISELLFELEKAGFNVKAARFELQAHRHHLEMKEQKLENLAKLTRDCARQAQHYLGHH